jgi:hypothetical protein
MAAFTVLLVISACIAALRINIYEQIDEHEQIMIDAEYEKY